MVKSILLVDDSHIVLDSLEKSLKEFYNILKALNGDSGFKISQTHRIDLFIIDYYMPYMDGITLTQKLRKTEQYSKTPIIILSSESSAELRTNAKRVGASGWIVKPFNMEKLLKIVNRLTL